LDRAKGKPKKRGKLFLSLWFVFSCQSASAFPCRVKNPPAGKGEDGGKKMGKTVQSGGGGGGGGGREREGGLGGGEGKREKRKNGL